MAFAAIAAGIVLTVVHAVAPFGGWGEGFVESWVYLAVELTAALLCAARAIVSRAHRAVNVALALGLTGWAAGDLYWLIYLRSHPEPPYPSWADLGYLSMYPLLSVAVVLYLRRHRERLGRLFLVDAAIAALGVGALSAAIVVEALLRNNSSNLLETAVSLGYPAGDMLTLSAIIGALVLRGWLLDGPLTRLAVGLSIGAVADSVYIVQIASDSYVEGSILDAGWLVAATLYALSAWHGPSDRARERQPAAWRVLLTPGMFGAISLGTLVYAHFERLNALSVVLAALSIVFVIVRMALTVHQNLALLAETRREALTDALTGLANRRRLLLDLDALLRERQSKALVLFDLNGFKGYNDSFGHPAGDALLARLGGRLDAFAAARGGRAYRLGGDEFCIVVPPGDVADASFAAAAEEALRESGIGFTITAAHGHVLLPDEAESSGGALAIADRRMYELKGARRAATVSQPVSSASR
jgi:two-component system cell cycle response regulator